MQTPIDQEKRDPAKVVTYGILFQMTAQGLTGERDSDTKTVEW